MSGRLRYGMMLALLLLAVGIARGLALRSDRHTVPPRASLASFPAALGAWRQSDAQTLGAGASRELAADEYLSRTFIGGNGATAYLFIAWYASQRHRRTFHSPQNCLPGAGWTMADHRVYSPGGDARNVLNEHRIEHDGARMIALYWYHGRGRMDASEYRGRLHTIEDAITRGRTDGALVRVIVPMDREGRMEEFARQAARDFAGRLIPLLPAYIPD
ncbi:MAG: exosortase C-terminal domain/associated protein EpsI [Blastocatellia bacterium]